MDQSIQGAYEYLLYRLLLWTRPWHGRDEQPEWGAAGLATCLAVLNGITVAIAVGASGSFEITVEALTGAGAVAGMVSLLLSYLVFVRKRRWISIIERFEGEAPGTRRARTISIVL